MQRPGRRELLIAGSSLLAGCSRLSGDDDGGGSEPEIDDAGGSESEDDDTGGSGSEITERYPSWQYDWQNSGAADDVSAPQQRPSLLWEREIGPGNGGATPVIADGKVFLGNGGSTFYALDAASGETDWTVETGKWIHSTAAIDGEFLAFGCDDFRVRAFHTDGTERWTYAADFEVSSDPVLTDELVIVTDTNGLVYAIERETGESAWTRTLETDSPGHMYSPALGPEQLYVGNHDTTWALSPDDGSTVWSTDDDRQVGGSHAVVDGRVVGVTFAGFGEERGTVHALDPQTGTVQWFHELEQSYPSDAAVVGNTVYMSDPDGLAARSASDGTVQWRVQLGDSCGTPVVADETVYVGSSSGIHAIDTDGTPRWKTDAATGDSGIAIASGTIFTKQEERLYALQ
ncbi:hypothetical protein GCM10028857_28380 [Salinarchaeum chitinilyticum]